MKNLILHCLLIGISFNISAQKKEEKHRLEKTNLSGLKFRSIGPALTSGRIADLAVNPDDYSEYYIATASGGIWKTSNRGITYHPIFDDQGSYSIGCLAMDPNNSKVIWAGTGENNNQRSVAYGDGLYKSSDGGKSWKKVGLENSEHIGMIAINPENSNEVYVAAYGPVWSSGGDRGIYKTTDGGSSWERVLHVSDHTGFNEVYINPQNTNVLYATAHQRRRHVWTYISGGPESAIYKSEDGGRSWDKLVNGIPGGDKGRIALAFPPSNPDLIYAMIEGHGIYRSDDRGASFSFMNKYYSSGNYYVELVPHPTNANIIYSMDTYLQLSKDGGRSWDRVPRKNRHVDDHCLWINPKTPEHMLVGGDGGLYETYDNGENWHFKPNLPITQFYKVSVDNATPFYNVYGGTQDNFSLGGPSRTFNNHGIENSDWFVTNTGDGFETAIDPENPDIIYAQSQYGGLVRFDKKSGEKVRIQPQPDFGEDAYRWNWDAPLMISPHNNKRLYFAANKVFRSNDQGNNWEVISPDLTQQINRHNLPVMGKIWSVDAIAYDKSTSNYGNIVAMDESELKENLLYIGTDDGLIQITEDGGKNWKRHNSFPGVPQNTYVNMILASKHDENTVFAAFNNHKNGDFKPYILKSEDKGTSWNSISGNLPDRGSVYSIAQDHVNKDLLFAGTEFGVFFTNDGGKYWKKLSNGLPTIAVRDIAIQKRENDLVLATMGRGFYILDDYSPLRNLYAETLDRQATIMDVSDAEIFLEASPLGYGGTGFQGASFYAAPNPDKGAIITYYLKDAPKSIKTKRQDKEKEAEKQNQTVVYPKPEELRAEDLEEQAYLIFVISDENAKEVSRFTKSVSTGVQRVNWEGRISSTASLNTHNSPMSNPNNAALAPEGFYTVNIYLSEDGKVKPLAGPERFELRWMNNHSMQATDKVALTAFQQKLENTRRDILAVNRYFDHLTDRIDKLKANVRNTPGADINLLDSLRQLEYALAEISINLKGDKSLASRSFDTPPSLLNRINSAVWASYHTTMEPTGDQKRNLQIIENQLGNLTSEIRSIADKAERINQELLDSGAPYLEGDLPKINKG